MKPAQYNNHTIPYHVTVCTHHASVEVLMVLHTYKSHHHIVQGVDQSLQQCGAQGSQAHHKAGRTQ